MTEVRKPGGNIEVAKMPFVFQLKTRTVSDQCSTNFLKILQQLENRLRSA